MSFTDANVLDIGFGRAYLLYCLRSKGAKVYGTELDQEAVAYAKALGIDNVSYGTLDDLKSSVMFDLIVMNDLIEHPLDPLTLLQQARSRLANGGLLLLWTPNGDTAWRETQPTIFRVDLEHMQYLTADSMFYLSQKLDLRIVHFECSGFPRLAGIDRSLDSDGSRAWRKARDYCKRLPGFPLISRCRQALVIRKGTNVSDGDYRMFCILRNGARQLNHR